MSNTASLMKLIQEDDVTLRESSINTSIINHGRSSSWINNKNTRINPFEDINSNGHGEGDVKIAVEEDGKEEVDPEAWLPITESRNGNLYYCVFHLVSSGIGVQSLVLPFAFISLGWLWGTICLSIAFIWQLYTTWLLTRLHESNSGYRYSRYLQLAISAFGPRLGKLLALFPIMYLSGGTCVMLLITGGATMQNLHHILCQDGLICPTNKLTIIEWYLIFICLAIVMAQLPNLNSIAWVSLVGSITALVYCSIIWVVSVSEGRRFSSGYGDVIVGPESGLKRVMNVVSAVGIIFFSFRGHNLVLEIQGTLPTSPKDATHKTMWKGVTISYTLIALCMFPMAIGGFWAYGSSISKAGLLNAFWKYHTSKFTLPIIYFFLIINTLCSFQVYAMLVFDNLELRYVGITKKPCSRRVRAGLRLFFGGLVLFISIAIPFLPVLAALIGGIALPVTFAYPCFMWISIKKPKVFGSMWWLNVCLGASGVFLSVVLIVAAILSLVTEGLDANFFHPKA